MSKDTLSITIDDRALRGLFNAFPRIANSEVNRGYKQVAAGFMKDFTKKRLVKGVFHVKRKGVFKSPKGQPVIPVKARKAGFIAKLGGRERLRGKWVEIRNSSPLITIREKGGVITPKPGKKWLYIHSDPGSKYAFGKKRKGKLGGGAAHYKWKQGKAQAFNSRPITAKMKKVGPFPRLGFKAAWSAYRSRLPTHYDKIEKRIVGTAQRFLDRKKAS